MTGGTDPADSRVPDLRMPDLRVPDLHVPDLLGEVTDPVALTAPAVPVRGPRRWWGGPLDVEGLALGSALAAARAAALWSGRADLVVDAARVAGAFGSIAHLRVDGRAPAGFAPLSGFFRCSDGWIRTHANYPHHERALLAALRTGRSAGDDPAASIRAALSDLPRFEAEARIRRPGGVAAAVRTPKEWASSPMGRSAASGPLVDIDPGSATGAPPRRSAARRPRVLDLTRVIAGPTCTQLLALLGADVLRIDPPQLPELLDQHLDRDHAKRSAVADLRDPSTRARVLDLLSEADVLVTGYRPGALAALGLDARTVARRAPQVVTVSLDAWGAAGPWSGERGFDSLVQAASGIAWLYGEDGAGADDGPSRRPGALPVQALDHATGCLMAAAAWTLLAHRERTGRAGRAHVSLAAVAARLLALPTAEGTVEPVSAELQESSSPHGDLVHAAPLLARTGGDLAFPFPPREYGHDVLAWSAAPPS